MSDQLDAETSTRQHTTLTRDRQTSMAAIPASDGPQTRALDRPATGIDTTIGNAPVNYITDEITSISRLSDD